MFGYNFLNMTESPRIGMVIAVMAVLLMISLPIVILANADEGMDRETLFQLNTLDAFLDGQYDGLMPYSEIFLKGDTGLGTFHAVDGEMIAFDGKFYQIRYDGSVNRVSGDMTAPLCMVTWFDVDATSFVNNTNLTETKNALDDLRDSENYIYVFVARGHLESVTTRSFAPFDEPYPPLSQANSSIFNAQNISGTLVIMWFPSSLAGINLDDYHMHFLSDDLSIGGHVVEMQVNSIFVEMDRTPNFYLEFPLSSAFRDWEYATDDRDVE